MPPLPILPIKNRSVRRDSVVPNDNSALLPLHSALQIRRQSDVVVQELEKVIALFLLEADDPTGELRVDVESLLASGRMCAHDGVYVADWLTTVDGSASSGGLSLFVARVHCLEAMKTFLELGGETLVGFGHVAEESVATCCWAVQEIQEGCSRWLHFEGDVGMPCHTVSTFLEVVLGGGVAGTAVDKMHARETLWCTTGLMDVAWPIVLRKIKGVLDW